MRDIVTMLQLDALVSRHGLRAAALGSLFVGLVACKPKLHAVTVEEMIVTEARKPGRLPEPALHCQTNFGGQLRAQVKVLRDDYTGIVHLRATDHGFKPCDGDFDFAMKSVDPPPGHRRRGSTELDLAYWDLTTLAPRP